MRASQASWPWRALLVAGSITLIGAVESPQPGGTPANAPPELTGGGGAATACVDSRLRWNHTGIRLESGHRYLIEAQGIWWDAGYRHGPGGGESATFFLGALERFRRVPKAPWFELICALDSRQDTAFRAGCRKEYDARENGELTCYANDVWIFYCNNTGKIEIKVRRIG